MKKCLTKQKRLIILCVLMTVLLPFLAVICAVTASGKRGRGRTEEASPETTANPSVRTEETGTEETGTEEAQKEADMTEEVSTETSSEGMNDAGTEQASPKESAFGSSETAGSASGTQPSAPAGSGYTDETARHEPAGTAPSESIVPEAPAPSSTESSQAEITFVSEETIPHEHVWEPIVEIIPEITHYETVTLQESYDETVIQEVCVGQHNFCSECHMDLTAAGFTEDQIADHTYEHIRSGGYGGHHTELIYEEVPVTVHHDAVTEERRIVDRPAEMRTIGYVCPVCGAVR